MNYGRAIRLARVIRGLGQVELAERAGVDKSYLSMIEMGKRDPGRAVREQIESALDLPAGIIVVLGATPQEMERYSKAVREAFAGQVLDFIVRGEERGTK